MRTADPANTIEQEVQLLRHLRKHGTQTRRQIVERTGQSVSQVRQLTQQLADLGLLVEAGIAPTDGAGRPSLVWSVAPEACYAVGLDVGGSWTRVAVLDSMGQVVLNRAEPTAQADSSQARLESLSRFVEDSLALLGPRRQAVRGLGVAFSGFVDFHHGRSLDALHIPYAHALPLHEYLTETFDLPVIVDDSSRAMALAEMRYGAARQSENFICVNVGIGIGTGIIINGQLYRGSRGLAGEVGHIPIMPQGYRCRCGGQGCLETLASGNAIAARARYLLDLHTPSRLRELCGDDLSQLTAQTVTKAALDGDELALGVLKEAASWLGIGLAILANLFSPDFIVLTGGVMRENHLMLSMVQAEMEKHVLLPLPHPFPIMLTELDTSVGALGAATLILDREYKAGFTERLTAAMQVNHSQAYSFPK